MGLPSAVRAGALIGLGAGFDSRLLSILAADPWASELESLMGIPGPAGTGSRCAPPTPRRVAAERTDFHGDLHPRKQSLGGRGKPPPVQFAPTSESYPTRRERTRPPRLANFFSKPRRQCGHPSPFAAVGAVRPTRLAAVLRQPLLRRRHCRRRATCQTPNRRHTLRIIAVAHGGEVFVNRKDVHAAFSP
jgi:hypothetical protein